MKGDWVVGGTQCQVLSRRKVDLAGVYAGALRPSVHFIMATGDSEIFMLDFSCLNDDVL